jgi:peptidoglycan/LPS O-acetylase OafA/YrhL
LELRTRLDSLTSTRFFAALVVLLAHFAIYDLLPVPDLFLKVSQGGGSAVTYFFVLSGFVLGFNSFASLKRFELRNFYFSRISRLFPMNLLFLVMSSSVLALTRNSDMPKVFFFNPQENILAFLFQAFMLSAWFPFSRIQGSLNSPNWSISVEIFFYLLFPLIIYVLNSQKRMIKGVLVFFILGIQGIVLLIWVTAEPGIRLDLFVFRSPILHLPEFFFGVVAAKLLVSKYKVLRPYRSSLLFASLISTGYTLYNFQYGPQFVILGPTSALLILSIALLNDELKFLRSRMIITLGDASFIIYLMHFPVLQVLIYFKASVEVSFISIIVIIIFSHMLSAYVEPKIRKRLLNYLLAKFAKH